MRLWSWLGPLVLACAASAGAAEQGACAECRASALADASQCHAVAAPDPALSEKCEKQFAQANDACNANACRAEADMQLAAKCADCLKQAASEAKKCELLPRDVRAACGARAAGMKKGCDDRLCTAPKAK
jgi:hypothetical protein